MTSGWSAHRERIGRLLRALRERGQSETLGVALLTGVVLILVAIIGLFLFADFGADDEEQLLANIEGDVEATNITLSHEGGDTFEPENVEVVLTGDAEREFMLGENFTAVEGGGGEFAPGDIWKSNDSGLIIGDGRLLVIHQPTSTILLDQPYSIEEDGVNLAVESISGQMKSDEATIHGNESWNYELAATLGGVSYDQTDNISFNVTFNGDEDDDLTWNDSSHVIEVDDISGEKTATAEAYVFSEDGEPLNETGTVDLTLKPEPEFTVSISDAEVIDDGAQVASSGEVGAEFIGDDALLRGDALNVTATVTNTNSDAAAGTQDIHMEMGPIDSGTHGGLTVPGGESRNVSFSVDVPDDAPTGNHTMEVWSDDDSDSLEVMVNSLPYFDVQITGTNAPLAPEDTLSVEADITNTGTLSDEQTVELSFTDESDSKTVSLDGGTSTTETFTATAPLNPGSFEATVSTANASDTQWVNVWGFNISLDTPTEVAAGETFTADVTLEKKIDADVALTTDVDVTSSLVQSGKTVTFDFESGEVQKTESVQLTAQTADGDGSVTATEVETGASADDSLTVLAPAIEIASYNAPDEIQVDEDLDVDYTLTNDGNEEGSVDVQLVIIDPDGNELSEDTNSETLTEDGTSGDTQSGTLTFSGVSDHFEPGGTIDYKIQLSGDSSDFVSDTVNITGAAYSVTITDTNSPAEGEDMQVTSEVSLLSTNTLGTQGLLGNQTLQLTAEKGGEVRTAETTISLASIGDTVTETLAIPTSEGDAGTWNVTVEVLDQGASDTATVAVQALEPDLTIDFANAPSSVDVSNDLSVDYQVTNQGTAEASSTIDLFVDATAGSEDSDALNLAPGESTEGTLVFSNVGDDYSPTQTIEWTVELSESTGQESGTTDVTGDPANFQTTISFTNSPVDEGDTLFVEADVENTGGVSDTQTITLDMGDVGTDSETISLASGLSQTVQFSIDTSAGDAGSHTAAVSSEDDTATETVQINSQGQGTVEVTSLDAPNTINPGDDLNVDYTIKNTGSAAMDVDIFVDLIPDAVGDYVDFFGHTTTLAPGETRSNTLTWDSSDLDSYHSTGDTINFEVDIYDNNEGGYLNNGMSDSTDYVDDGGGGGDPQADFEVTITNAPDTMDIGDSLAVDYSVTNVGNAAGDDTAELNVDGAFGDPQDTNNHFSVDPGQTVSGTLVYSDANQDFNQGDTITFTVELQNDGATDAGSTDINEPAPSDLAITNINVNTGVVDLPVGESETVDVDYTVENSGGSSAQNVEVELHFEGGGNYDFEDSDTYNNIPPGQSDSGTLSGTVDTGFLPGSVTAEVSIAGESGTAVEGTIDTKALRISDFSVSDTVHPYRTEEEQDIGVTVYNKGSVQASDYVDPYINDVNTYGPQVTVDGQSTETVYPDLNGQGFGDYSASVRAELFDYNDISDTEYATMDIDGDLWVGSTDSVDLYDDTDCGYVTCDFDTTIDWSSPIYDPFNRASAAFGRWYDSDAWWGNERIEGPANVHYDSVTRTTTADAFRAPYTYESIALSWHSSNSFNINQRLKTEDENGLVVCGYIKTDHETPGSDDELIHGLAC